MNISLNVYSFTYLGSPVSNNGDVEVDVNYRIEKVTVVFQKMHWLWSTKMICMAVKICLYNFIIMPTVPMLVKHGRTQPVSVKNLSSSTNNACAEYSTTKSLMMRFCIKQIHRGCGTFGLTFTAPAKLPPPQNCNTFDVTMLRAKTGKAQDNMAKHVEERPAACWHFMARG